MRPIFAALLGGPRATGLAGALVLLATGPSCRPTVPTLAGAEIATTFDVQGHRGARAFRPENTLPGFELALDLGVRTLEFDLHLTADDVVVVWHDPVLSPGKCRGPGLQDGQDGPRLRDLRYQDLALYTCDLNPSVSRFPEQVARPGTLSGADFRIVSLDSLIDFVRVYSESGAKTAAQRRNAGRVAFNMETKRVELEPWRIGDGFDGSRAGVLEREILRVLRKHDIVDRSVVQSFDFRSLRAIKAAAPELTTSALTAGDIDVEAVVALGAAYWSPFEGVLTRDRVEEAHRAGLRVLPWTVNDAARARELIQMGVDGLITDLGPGMTYLIWP